MSSLLTTRNVLLFFSMVCILVSYAQEFPDPIYGADNRKRHIIQFCKGLIGASDDDVWRWEKGLKATWKTTCFVACLSRRLPFEDPPMDHYSHKIAQENGCRTY